MIHWWPMTATSFATQEGLPVRLPSGAVTKVQTEEEVAYVTDRAERYTSDNHFYNISDIQSVDLMIILELQCWRAANFLNRGGLDYMDKPVAEPELRRSLSSMSNEIRQIKKILRIDKNARDAERGENSVAAYLENLRQRAQEFGVHRDGQHAKIIELGMQLIALATYHKNCLSGDTRVLTSAGTRCLRDLAGECPTLLVGSSGGAWRPAEVRSFGYQRLWQINLVRKQGGATRSVHATADHSWFIRDANGRGRLPATTCELKQGDQFVSVYGHIGSGVRPSAFGIAAGIAFGDGTRSRFQPGSPSEITLCDAKEALIKFFPLSPTRGEPGRLIVCDMPRSWKTAPRLDEGSSYILGWLMGYFATDGYIGGAGDASITSSSAAAIQTARDICYKLGIPTLGVTSTRVVTPYSNGLPVVQFRLNFPVSVLREEFFLMEHHRIRAASHARRARTLAEWSVVSVVRTDRVEEVFCAVVPDVHSFVLDDNILTGNCTDEERRELGITLEDLYQWIMDVFSVQLLALDREFRQRQKMWIREM